MILLIPLLNSKWVKTLDLTFEVRENHDLANVRDAAIVNDETLKLIQ